MMKFEIQCEGDSNDARVVQKTLIVMEAVIELNQLWLSRYKEDACFLTCGDIEYDFKREYELSNVVDIKTIPILKMTGKGLCIDFVCFDVAIRRMMGQQAFPEIMDGDAPGVFHIITVVKEGDKEVRYDPSKEIAHEGGYKSAHPVCAC